MVTEKVENTAGRAPRAQEALQLASRETFARMREDRARIPQGSDERGLFDHLERRLFDADLTMPSLVKTARVPGSTSAKLGRLLKRKLAGYVESLRIETAARMEDSGLLTGQIAAAVGIPSMYSFEDAYRRHTGKKLSPIEADPFLEPRLNFATWHRVSRGRLSLKEALALCDLLEHPADSPPAFPQEFETPYVLRGDARRVWHEARLECSNRLALDCARLPNQVVDFFRFVAANLHTRLRINQSITDLGIGDSGVRAQIKFYFGETARGYLEKRRIEVALWLLCLTDLSVVKVAETFSIGYETFVKACRRRLGETPSEIRRGKKGRGLDISWESWRNAVRAEHAGQQRVEFRKLLKDYADYLKAVEDQAPSFVLIQQEESPRYAIPDEILQNPEIALDHPGFSGEKGAARYLHAFGDWTFGMADSLRQRAADVGVELARAHGKELQIRALKYRGSALRAVDADAALKEYRQAMKLHRQIFGDPVELADIYRRIGCLEEEQGNEETADEAHYLSIKLLPGHAVQPRAIAYGAWGASLLTRAFEQNEQGLFLESANLFREAIRMLNASPPEPLVAALGNLVTAEMMVGFPENRLDENFAAFQEARQSLKRSISGNHGARIDYLDLMICWAQCYLVIRQNLFSDALIELRRVRKGFEQLGQQRLADEVALDQALIHAILGQWETAETLVALHANVLPLQEAQRLLQAVVDRKVVAFSIVLGAANTSYKGRSPAVIAAGLQQAS